MTLYELALEYEQSAALLRGRISELERAMREAGDELSKARLDRRLRPLRSMYRDTQTVSRYLSGYYRKFTPRRGTGTPGPREQRRN